MKDIYTYRPSVTPNENNTSSFYVDIRNAMKLKWQGASLTTGIQFTSQNILSNDRGNHEHLHSGF